MISSNASTILPSNMNEEQRLHQEKKAEVENVAALEAALDAFTVIRSPSGSTCDFVRLSASHVVGGRRIAFIKKAGFKVSKWIVVNGQEVLRNDSTCRSYVLKRRHATFLHELGDTLEQQAEEHHRGHGPTAACSRRRTRRACSNRSRRAQMVAILSQRALQRHHSGEISPPQTMDRGQPQSSPTRPQDLANGFR